MSTAGFTPSGTQVARKKKIAPLQQPDHSDNNLFSHRSLGIHRKAVAMILAGLLGSDGFDRARLQRVRKKNLHNTVIPRNLLFFGIPVEKQIPPPPKSEFGMTVAEASAFFGSL